MNERMDTRTAKPPVTRALVTAVAASYAANAAFGVAVATEVIDNRRIRWAHHALFVTTASLTALSLAAAAIQRQPAGLALLPAAGVLTALPRVRGGTGRHAFGAGLAAPAFLTALVLAWRRR